MATSTSRALRSSIGPQLAAAFEWVLAGFAPALLPGREDLETVASEAVHGGLVEELSAALEALGPDQSGTTPEAFVAGPSFRALIRSACVVVRPAPSEVSGGGFDQIGSICRTLWPLGNTYDIDALQGAIIRAAEGLHHAAECSGLSSDGRRWPIESPLAAMEAVCSQRPSGGIARPTNGGLTTVHQVQVRPGLNDRVDAFRRRVATSTGFLTPPRIDAVRRRPIAELYVPSNIQLAGGADGYTPAYQFDQLSRCFFRTVILGNPGGGKTTLAQRIANLLAGEHTPRLDTHVPLFVQLRAYGGEQSLLEFIMQELRQREGGDLEDSDLRYLLTVGGAAVLLDGLDELLDTGERRDLVAAVSRFAEEFGAAPILVTSREVGYSEAPLGSGGFQPWLLAPFDEEQATEYANKWFSADTTLPKASRTQMASGLIDECREVPDLRSNPLLLALLCQIYRGEGYIPRNRPAVYEKCAVMLFERWDRGRGLYAPTSIEAHLRPAMEHLAYWIFSTPELAGGVTEAQLLEQASQYLHTWRYESATDARAAAHEFIEFCRGRAWVFTDTGTTGAGEPVYQFSHRTFLEYFAALDLVRTKGPSDELLQTLLPHVARQEWDIVATMAFQIAADYRLGAGDELIAHALDAARASASRSERTAPLAFVTRCLSVLVPRPATTRAVCDAALRDALDIAMGAPRLERYGNETRHGDGATTRTLDAFLTVTGENWEPAQAALLSVAADFMQRDRRARLACADIFGNLSSFFRSLASESARQRWIGTTNTFVEQHLPELDALATQDLLVAHDLATAGRLSHGEFLARFGPTSYFAVRPLPDGLGARISLADAAFHWSLTGGAFGLPSAAIIEGLEAAGRLLSRVNPPWVEPIHWGMPVWAMRRDDAPDLDELPDFARFMSAALLCIHIENEVRSNRTRLPDAVPGGRVWAVAIAVMRARRGRRRVPSQTLVAAVEDAFGDDATRRILVGWATREFPVIGEPGQLELAAT